MYFLIMCELAPKNLEMEVIKSLSALDEKIRGFFKNNPKVEDIQSLKSYLDAYQGDDWRERVKFDTRKYTREILFKNKDFELILLGWLPHQKTTLHNHPEQGCVAKVLSGTLEETSVSKEDDAVITDLREGDIVYNGRSDIHQIKNKSAENAVSLHLYSPGKYVVYFGDTVEEVLNKKKFIAS